MWTGMDDVDMTQIAAYVEAVNRLEKGKEMYLV